MDVKSDEKVFVVSREKLYKVFFKEENWRLFLGDNVREKLFFSGVKKEKDREGSSLKKKCLFFLEVVLDNYLKKLKYRDLEKVKLDKSK